MTEEATREGVSEKDDKDQKKLKVDSRRHDAMEELAARFEEQRLQELREQEDADPGMKATSEKMAKEQEESEAEQEAAAKSREEEAEADGLETLEIIESDEDDELDEPESDLDEEESEGQDTDDDDPLAEFIVEHDGEPHVRLKVDGETRFLPLDKARAELQKRESGDARLQQASDWNRSLEQREEAVRQAEQRLAARAEISPEPPSGKADVDDEAIKDQAVSLVKSLFDGTEEEAVEAVTHVLAGRASSPTPVDIDEIAEKAAKRADEKAREREEAERAKAVQAEIESGVKAFEEEFRDICADPHLFRVADDMTTEIAEEHPDWSPKQVMMEAGERTRKWWGKQPERKAELQAGEEDLADRQKRKKQLKPMPRRATAKSEKTPEEKPETPADILAEMRASRKPLREA